VKKVEALIRPCSLHAVTKALDRLDVGGVTISDVEVSGDSGLRASYRGATYLVDAFSKLFRVEVVSTDAYAGPIAWAIATAARTGHPDDGMVSIETVEEACRIRTGERGTAAVSARLDPADVSQITVAPQASDGGMSDSTKVLLTNVVLTTLFLVVFFQAPVGYAGLGAGSAGLLLWARERRARARRTR
jgi:nitrogen regulatory protein P-II 1